MTRSKTYEQLTFTDDFMFCKILSTDLDLTKDLLELILGISINKVELAQSQKELKFTPADHGVRFDVYVEDDATKKNQCIRGLKSLKPSPAGFFKVRKGSSAHR